MIICRENPDKPSYFRGGLSRPLAPAKYFEILLLFAVRRKT